VRIDHHHFIHADGLTYFLTQISQLNTKVDRIMAQLSELATELRAVKDQVVKTRVETLAKIKKLEDALANSPGTTTPEVDTAMAELKAAVQTSDDDIADEPIPA
jgi:ElaB/YqjD/DUF883 family membrane-anchored ribosome-binding protein